MIYDCAFDSIENVVGCAQMSRQAEENFCPLQGAEPHPLSRSTTRLSTAIRACRREHPLIIAITGACRALNRIQSKIYDRAFNSNENVLVCAPTGAGKTNIAMLAVLHEIGANMVDGTIQARQAAAR